MKEKKNYWTRLMKKFVIIPVKIGTDPGSAGSKGKFRDASQIPSIKDDNSFIN